MRLPKLIHASRHVLAPAQPPNVHGVNATMPEVLATLSLEVPYDGLSSLAGMGFALDQFARAQGFHNFAEWAAAQFQKGRSIAASVAKSDDLDTSNSGVLDRTSTGFGYEVTVWVAASDDE